MKATGIVRRIDDLGRVVIPKEIRRTMRIREGDPLEIFTDRDGGVIFKKYSPIGELSGFAAHITESLSKAADSIAAVCDRDSIIAIAGGGKRELMDGRVSPELEQLMDSRAAFTCEAGLLPVTANDERFRIVAAQPVISDGDVLGCIMFVAPRDESVQHLETKLKLVQTVAGFIGKQMES